MSFYDLRDTLSNHTSLLSIPDRFKSHISCAYLVSYVTINIFMLTHTDLLNTVETTPIVFLTAARTAVFLGVLIRIELQGW